MNIAKIVLGFMVGAVTTGVLFAFALRYIEEEFYSGSNFFGFDGWWLSILVGATYGVVIGGASGAVIAGLELNFVKSIFCGFLFGLILSLFLLFWSGDPLERKFIFILCALIVIGTANGAAISLVTHNLKSVL